MDYNDWQAIKNHYYLGSRNSGPSKALRGDVVVINILVNDYMSNWMYPAHVMEYQNAFNAMSVTLMSAAAASGASLTVRSVFYQVNLPAVADAGCSWLPNVFQSLGYANTDDMQRRHEQAYSCDETPIIIGFNRPMRSFAIADNAKNIIRFSDETSVVFRHLHGFFDPTVFEHELLHQFGAVDYYYPDSTVRAAQKYFPASIMYQGGPEIDDLTRYLIGWTDELTPKAIAFLKETSDVDELALMRARMRGI